ncbi:NADP oxidoreductase coenzyme F420-dependent [Streptococcus infantis SK970]|nr:NADP oxidoreductase coenzyme F420-dependent [Streptococcus infantis SK970]
MKIILVGGGKVGSALCRSLVADNHDVVLIEQNETVLNYMTSRFDIIGIAGNGADFAMLEAANVQDCDIFIAMTQYDEVNMVSAVLAKKWEPRKPSFVFVILNILILTLKKKYSRIFTDCQPRTPSSSCYRQHYRFP